MKIEGIPDGWELVRVGYVKRDEHYMGLGGAIMKWDHSDPTEGVYPIIRKTEKPKRYRPFAKLIEAQPLVGEVLRFKVNHQSMSLFVGITSSGFQIGLSHWSPREAFDSFETLEGTPFGIEVTE